MGVALSGVPYVELGDKNKQNWGVLTEPMGRVPSVDSHKVPRVYITLECDSKIVYNFLKLKT